MIEHHPLSSDAKDCLVFEAVWCGVVWLTWPLLWYLIGFYWTVLIINVAIFACLKYSASQRKLIESEIKAYPLAFRRYAYATSKWLFGIVAVPQVIAAIYFRGVLVWVMTGTVLLVGVAILVHDWQEVKNLEPKEPNQPLQPNAGAPPYADEALPPRG